MRRMSVTHLEAGCGSDGAAAVRAGPCTRLLALVTPADDDCDDDGDDASMI